MPKTAFPPLSAVDLLEQVTARFSVGDERYSITKMNVGEGHYWLNVHPNHGRPTAIAAIDNNDRDVWLWVCVDDEERYGTEDTLHDAIIAALHA